MCVAHPPSLFARSCLPPAAAAARSRPAPSRQSCPRPAAACPHPAAQDGDAFVAAHRTGADPRPFRWVIGSDIVYHQQHDFRHIQARARQEPPPYRTIPLPAGLLLLVHSFQANEMLTSCRSHWPLPHTRRSPASSRGWRGPRPPFCSGIRSGTSRRAVAIDPHYEEKLMHCDALFKPSRPQAATTTSTHPLLPPPPRSAGEEQVLRRAPGGGARAARALPGAPPCPASCCCALPS